jgi:hypothetical protein
MKVMKVRAELDDKAYEVAKFVQELSKIQDQYFEDLMAEVKAKNLVADVEEAELRDWLFDYVFNGYNPETRDIEEMFSEYVIY